MLSATVIVCGFNRPYEAVSPPPPATLADAVEDEPLAASSGTVIVKVEVPDAPSAKLRDVPELLLIHAASKNTEKSSAPFPPLVTV